MNRLLFVLVATLLSACGGSAISPAEAFRLLLDQGAECYAVAAGRVSPERFNAVAADIASVAQPTVCMAWPAGLTIQCADAYALYSKPYSSRCL